MEYILTIVVILIVIILFKVGAKRITIFEYEKGLKYVKGRFKSVLVPGQYWYLPYFSMIQKVDIRPRYVSITGQEVLSSDGVTLKVSLAANFEIIDPDISINKVNNFQESLYIELQLAVREIIGGTDIDTVLSNRNELSKKIMENTESKIKILGIKLISVNIKDIMFPGKLKEIFAQVVNAKKEGLAALEKARGETAALRNLANAAKILEGNPNLMQLRMIQSFGESSGNTLILGIPSHLTPVPITSKNANKEIRESATENHTPD